MTSNSPIAVLLTAAAAVVEQYLACLRASTIDLSGVFSHMYVTGVMRCCLFNTKKLRSLRALQLVCRSARAATVTAATAPHHYAHIAARCVASSRIHTLLRPLRLLLTASLYTVLCSSECITLAQGKEPVAMWCTAQSSNAVYVIHVCNTLHEAVRTSLHSNMVINHYDTVYAVVTYVPNSRHSGAASAVLTHRQRRTASQTCLAQQRLCKQYSNVNMRALLSQQKSVHTTYHAVSTCRCRASD
eukprot:10820-Heterococcus_DN1.PRE.3